MPDCRFTEEFFSHNERSLLQKGFFLWFFLFSSKKRKNAASPEGKNRP